MQKITIYEFLKKNEGVIKDGYVAMDKNGDWCWFSDKPYKRTHMWVWRDLGDWRPLTRAFNIAPFDGDWKVSLIKIEHKEE